MALRNTAPGLHAEFPGVLGEESIEELFFSS
jgi:hypothetical protein